jgi:hypothetical protein
MIVIFANRNMKQLSYTILLIIVILAGCKKDVQVRTTGTDTIDNVRHMSTTWFTYGFSFSTGKLVSTETTPKPDITVDTLTAARPNVYLQGSINTFFSKIGDYPDENSARAAFDGLKTINVTNWVDWANPILPNQVWVFKSGSDLYTKFRIITIVQRRDQGIPVTEITFQWVHQPDASLIFP